MSNRRVMELTNDLKPGMVKLVEFSNRRLVGWWIGGVFESSSGAIE